MEIDESTGLPKLPKGYFFRVSVSGNNSRLYYVCLMRKRFGLYSSEVDVHGAWRRDGVAGIKEAAEALVKTHFTKLAYQNDPLVGDYPPKKLPKE